MLERSRPSSPLYDALNVRESVSWYWILKLYWWTIGSAAWSKAWLRMVPTNGFAAVNPASDALAATIGMGVLMVYGGVTVFCGVMVGDATTGTFGKFPENCVTC